MSDPIERAEIVAVARAVADAARPAATSTYNSYEDARAAAAVVEAFERFAATLEQIGTERAMQQYLIDHTRRVDPEAKP